MSVDLFNNVINQDFDYLLQQLGKSIKINGIDATAVINSKDGQFDDKEILTKSDLKCGDIINYNNGNWIVINYINDKRYLYYNKCIIKACKRAINFIINGFLKEFPCIIVSNNQGISSNQYFNIPDGTIKLTLQENTDTRQIAIDDRFIKMNSAWKITGITNENEGLLYVTASKDVINTTTDDMVNEIANTNKLHSYKILINNGDTSSINVSGTLQLNCVCTDNNVTVSSPLITYSTSDSTIATIDDAGKITGIKEGTATITVTFNNVIDTIQITVTNITTDNYTINLTPLGTNNITTIIYNHNKTFNAVVQNNGVDTNDMVIFELFNVDSVYSYDKLGSIISSTGNSCVIQTINNTSMIGKKFGLRCKIVDNESVFVERIIKVGSLS